MNVYAVIEKDVVKGIVSEDNLGTVLNNYGLLSPEIRVIEETNEGTGIVLCEDITSYRNDIYDKKVGEEVQYDVNTKLATIEHILHIDTVRLTDYVLNTASDIQNAIVGEVSASRHQRFQVNHDCARRVRQGTESSVDVTALTAQATQYGFTYTEFVDHIINLNETFIAFTGEIEVLRDKVTKVNSTDAHGVTETLLQELQVIKDKYILSE